MSIIKANGYSKLEQLPEKEVALCAAILEINKLRDFKMDDAEIMEWKDTILKLEPDVTPEILVFVVEQMMLGKIEYRKDLGIRNIFLGLKEVELKDGKLKLKSQYRY